MERHRQVKQEYEEQALASEQDIGRVAQIDYFINTLEEMDAPVTEFDDQLWISMVDHVVVHSKDDIRVVYRFLNIYTNKISIYAIVRLEVKDYKT